MQKRGLKSLAAICAPHFKESLSRAGFAATEVVTQWPAIVGQTIAQRSRPLKIAFPRRPVGSEAQDPGTLHVLVEPGFALEVQHMSGTILEQVNAYFGWACVQSVKLKTATGLAKASMTNIPAKAVDMAHVEQRLAGIEDAGLKEALRKLGRAISSR